MPMDGDQAAQTLLSGEAWASFCDDLKAAGASLHRDTAMRSAVDAAEGYRFMTRMLRSALELVMEGGDAEQPYFMRSLSETIKVGWDNPDNHHTNAYINGAHSYRVWGNRGEALYIGFGVYGGSYGKGGGRRTVAYVSVDDLEVRDDGSFEVVLSTKEHPGNWVPIDADATTLMIRETFSDRQNQRNAELRIERLDAGPAPPLDPLFVASALRRSARYVQGSNKLFFDMADLWMQKPNTFFASDPELAKETQGIPDMYYGSGWWQCGEEEAVVLDVDPPDCRYWGFVLSNYWGESFDYLHHPVNTNKFKATYRADGKLRMVLAHRDPGLPDATWISTANHVDGIWTLRWLEADRWPHPEIRVVPFDALNSLV
jgi:hypothetical protein